MSETKDPYVYRIKSITKVVDGDTIDANIDLGFDISLTKRIRLAGIDSPESRTTNLKEKALGLESKEWLKKTLEDAKDILIKTENQIAQRSMVVSSVICLSTIRRPH
jgi:micrococcal nuclease